MTSRQVREDGFTMIEDWFLRVAVPALGLKAVHVAAYTSLKGRADSHGYCHPSYDLIAHEGGMTHNTAANAVRRLVKEGLVAIESAGNGTSHHYRVLPRPKHLPATAPEVKRKKKGDARGHAGTQEMGASDAVEPTQEMGISESSIGRDAQKVGTSYPGNGSVGTQRMGTKYTHQVHTGRTHIVVPEPRTSDIHPRSAEVVNHIPGAPAPETAQSFSWGWNGLLGRGQWDEYASEYERVHGEPLRVEETMHGPRPDDYAEKLGLLKSRATFDPFWGPGWKNATEDHWAALDSENVRVYGEPFDRNRIRPPVYIGEIYRHFKALREVA